MKYLYLIYMEAGAREPDPAGASLDFSEALERGGHRIVVGALEPAGAALSVRLRDGGLTLAEGPESAAGEQLAGFCLIEARDLNDAIRLAAGHPAAGAGSVQIWPVRGLTGPPGAADK